MMPSFPQLTEMKTLANTPEVIFGNEPSQEAAMGHPALGGLSIQYLTAVIAFTETVKAVEKISTDPFLTHAQKLQRAAQLAGQHLAEVGRATDKAIAEGKARIQAIDKTTGADFAPATHATTATLDREIRDYLRGIPEPDRLGFAVKAARSGDSAVVRAVVHAPEFLTGLSANDRATVQDAYIAAAHPEEAHERARLESGIEQAGKCADVLHRHIRRLIDFDELHRLEGLSSAPEAA